EELVDVLLAVREREKHRLERRRREIEAALEHAEEKGAKPGAIETLNVGERRRALDAEEERQHRPDTLHASRDTVTGEDRLQTGGHLGPERPAKRPCAPPRPRRKPVITSSKMSSAPQARVASRRAMRNPGCGGTTPMLAATGSTITAASSDAFAAT